MYQRILVPLDGSEFAEQALCHAQSIASVGKGEIHLLTVAPLLEDQALALVDLYPVYVYRDFMVDRDQEMARVNEELEAYLKQTIARLEAAGQRVQWSIRYGQPPEEIIAYVEEKEIDLVTMSTHGRSGLGRWVYGSVADRVLRGCQVPVLLVRVQDLRT